VAIPFTHVGLPHMTLVSGNELQTARFTPSHIPPHIVPVPAQGRRTPRGPPATATHLPTWFVSAHDSHWPVQSASQHTLSVQWLLRQSSATEQAWPCLVLHAPSASQVFVPVQVSASSALVTATQVPPPPVQAWQEPQAVAVQQRPSTQLPVVQSLPSVHVLPGLVLQAPAAVQVLVPVQLSGSSALVMPTHVPLVPVQAWQAAQLVLPQQRLSMQWPEVHSLSAPQALPFGFLFWQAAAELQNCVLGQGAVVLLQPPEHIIMLAAHWLLEHGVPEPGAQPPLLSQVGAGVATPFVQLGFPHITFDPGNTQATRLAPPHIPAHMPVPPVHCCRTVPRGAPVTTTQLPLVVVSPQDSHWPVQSLSQQKPSAQWLVMQSPAPAQAWPCLALHTPALSQVLVPLQVSASSPPATDTHAPPPPVQAWHVPQELAVQQCPSTQFPVEQSVDSVQLWPGLVLHTPLALQVRVMVQVSGSSALVTDTQVPFAPVQAWHDPQAVLAQQWPSTQLPDMQVASRLHMAPLANLFWQAPAPLQNWVDGQATPLWSQPPAQRVASAQTPLMQAAGVDVRQAPARSQVGELAAMPSLQVGPPHMVCSSG